MESQQIYEKAKKLTNLRERAKLVVEAIRPLMSEDEIAQIATEEDEYLRNRYSVSSLGSKMSSAGYNKLIKSILLAEGKNAQKTTKLDAEGNVRAYELKHYFFKYCGLSKSKFYPDGKVPDEWQKRNQSTRILERAKNAQSYPLKPDKHIEKTYQLLEKENFGHLGAGLIAASGRRPHELFRGEFSPIEGEQWAVMFSGQGKKRENTKVPKFAIATLVEAKYFLKKCQQFKQHQKYQKIWSSIIAKSSDKAEQNRAIDRLTNSRYNRIIDREFQSILTPRPNEHGENDLISATDLRSAYLCLAVARDVKGSMTAKIVAAARLAGHLIEGENGQALTDRDLSKLTYSIGYGAYYVPDEVEVPFIEAPLIEPLLPKVQPEQQEQTEIDQLKHQLERKQEKIETQQKKIAQLEKRLNQLETALQEGRTRTKVQTRDWESVSKDELFGLGKYEKPARGVGSAEEKIRRSVE
ncbi:MAG: protelomerase family protein, partial [Spirulinaceae cyanobacterium]